ncbi:MAG: DNA-directed RNA polymerase subunit omega [Phycisphaerae bacterium]
MIEELKSDEIVHKMGGRFKLCALVQHRWRELINGARPLVERERADGHKMTDLELIYEEIKQNKIGIDFEKSKLTPPAKALGDE